MPNEAVLAVLTGAFLNASWNAAVKSGADKFLQAVLVAIGAGAIAAAALPFLPLPAPESWPYLAFSTVLQVIYFGLLSAAYRRADMSFAYPLMRGTAPLIVAVTSGVLLGETLSTGAAVGIALICGSVLALTVLNRAAGGGAMAVAFALTNATVIAAYTISDGVGGRLSGTTLAYTLWLSLLTAPPLVLYALWRNPSGLRAALVARWWVALGGGAATLGSYALALWAMTRAPIAATAALRETSILFGLAIAALVLKERVGPARLAAAAMIAVGAATLRLA